MLASEQSVIPLTPLTRWMSAHPRIIDTLAVLACLATQWAVMRGPGTSVGWEQVLVIVSSSVSLFWRRSSPMTVVVTVSVIAFAGILYSPESAYQRIPAAFALYTVASRQSLPRAFLGYGITVAFPVAASLILGMSGPVLFSPSLLEPLTLVALTLGIAVKAQNDRRKSLETLIKQRVESAAMAERARITAEMHDVVAHSITVMIALAGGARSAWDTDPQKARQALEHLTDVGGTALDEMQRILKILRQSDHELDRALHASGYNVQPLSELVDVFRAAGLPVTLDQNGAPVTDPALATTIHRIVQEALTNSLRYANNPTTVSVEITTSPDGIDLAITDDGHPHRTPPTGSGVGLTSIRERAAAYGGTVQTGPRPEGGWATTVHLPTPARSRA